MAFTFDDDSSNSDDDYVGMEDLYEDTKDPNDAPIFDTPLAGFSALAATGLPAANRPAANSDEATGADLN